MSTLQKTSRVVSKISTVFGMIAGAAAFVSIFSSILSRVLSIIGVASKTLTAITKASTMLMFLAGALFLYLQSMRLVGMIFVYQTEGVDEDEVEGLSILIGALVLNPIIYLVTFYVQHLTSSVVFYQ